MPATTIRIISNTRAQLEGEYPFTEVSDRLAYRPPGYQFMAAFKRHVWDGYIRLLTSNGTFPAGLAWLVESCLVEHGCTVTWQWDVKRPPLAVKHTRDITLGGVTLYPWQAKAVRIALERGRGVLKVATGGGKTEVVAGLVRCLEGERPPKTLIVVPNRNLLIQTKKRLEERLGYEVGAIGFGKWQEDYVTVAIPDTLSAPKFQKERIELMNKCEMILLDECHHTPSQKWSTIVGRCKAFYRFGLSGTPLDRGDGSDLKLEGSTGPMLVDISSSLLVSQGKLAKPTVEMVDVTKPSLPEGLDFHDIYTLGIVRNLHFHRLLVSKVAAFVKAKKQVLVLVTRIDHGNALSAEMNLVRRKPIAHAFVHGKTDIEVLKARVEEFKAGKLPVLIASPIFGEGTDIPNIDVLVVADGGKSVIKTVQKAGRAMRPKKGRENVCRLVDFRHYTHGKLLEHSEARIETYRREKFEIEEAT